MKLKEQVDLLWLTIEKQFQLAVKNDELTEELCRLKKLFSKLSEKKSVFQKLVQALEDYVQSKQEDYVKYLSDLALITDRLRLSLFKLDPIEKAEEIKSFEDTIHFREDSWLSLQPLVKAMAIKGSGRLKALEQAFNFKTYQTRQLLPYIVEACGDSFSIISELALTGMLPFFGKAGLVALQESLNFDGGKSEENKLRYLLKYLEGDDYQILLETVLSSTNVSFQKEVLKICKVELWMKEYLVRLSQSRSLELSQLAKCMFEKLPG